MAKLKDDLPSKKPAAKEESIEKAPLALPSHQRIQTAEGWKRSQLKKRQPKKKASS